MLFLLASESIKAECGFERNVSLVSGRQRHSAAERGSRSSVGIVLFVTGIVLAGARTLASKWLFRFVRLTLSGCVIVTLTLSFSFLREGKCITVTSARRVENCNHVITCPTVRLIGFKVPLGLWFLTAGR